MRLPTHYPPSPHLPYPRPLPLSHPRRHHKHKRIVLTPPQDFLDSITPASIFAAPVGVQGLVGGTIVFGPDGQATLIPSAAPATPAVPVQGGGQHDMPVAAGAQVGTMGVQSVAAAPASSRPAVVSANAVSSVSAPQPTSSDQPTSTSPLATTTNGQTSSTASPTSSTGTSSGTSSTTSLISSTTISTSSTHTSLTLTATSHTTTSSSSASVSASAIAASQSNHFGPGALFWIFIALAILASAGVLSTLLCCFCRRRSRRRSEDEEFGTDRVPSFTTTDDASLVRRSLSFERNDSTEQLMGHNALQHRASLLATSPSASGPSPFLHSTNPLPYTSPYSYSNGGVSVVEPGAVNNPGPLGVRNLVDGDMSRSTTGLQGSGQGGVGTPREVGGEKPRFLGIDGGGLEVPWNQPSHNNTQQQQQPYHGYGEIDLERLGFHNYPALEIPVPTPTPADAPSPATGLHTMSSLMSEHQTRSSSLPQTEPEKQEPPATPTRSNSTQPSIPETQLPANWAVSLRRNLFAAINSVSRVKSSSSSSDNRSTTSFSSDPHRRAHPANLTPFPEKAYRPKFHSSGSGFEVSSSDDNYTPGFRITREGSSPPPLSSPNNGRVSPASSSSSGSWFRPTTTNTTAKHVHSTPPSRSSSKNPAALKRDMSAASVWSTETGITLPPPKTPTFPAQNARLRALAPTGLELPPSAGTRKMNLEVPRIVVGRKVEVETDESDEVVAEGERWLPRGSVKVRMEGRRRSLVASEVV